MPVGRGDVTVEDLLVHGSWVRALARSLASDVHAADDAEQQAWVAALTRSPPRAENLRAWFARVVRRRLSDRRRSEGRRARTEAAARRSGDVLPPDELVVRAETQLAVAREVLALAEPYRTAVLLRFFEGMGAEEISRLQDVPVATVRTRLQRALQQLRSRLTRVLGREKGARLAALGVGAGGGAGSLAPMAAGGLIMTAQAKVVCVVAGVVLLLGGGYAAYQVTRRAGPTPDFDESAARSPLERPGEPGLLGRAPSGDGEGAPPPLATATAPPPATPAGTSTAGDLDPAFHGTVVEGDRAPAGVVGGVVRDETGKPVAGASVLLWDEVDDVARKVRDSVRTAPDGTFRFERLPDGMHTISVHVERRMPVNTRSRVSGRLVDVTLGRVLPLPPTAITGTVVEEGTGRPLAEIPILAWPAGGSRNEPRSSATTAEDGSFALAHVTAGKWTLVVGSRALDRTGPAAEFLLRQLGPIEAGTKDVRVEVSRGLAIEGEIRGPDGAPWTAGATVRAIPVSREGRLGYDEQRWAKASSDGTFRVPGLQVGAHDLTIEATAPAEGAAEAALALVARVPAGSSRVVVALRIGRRIHGRLLDESDAPIMAKGWVWVYEEGSEPGNPGSVSAKLEPEGRFQTAPLDPGRAYFLRASGFPGYADGEPTAVPLSDGDLVVRLTRLLRIEGRVVDSAGKPAGAFVPVVAMAASAGDDSPRSGTYMSGATDSEGRFALGGLLADVPYVLVAGGGFLGWVSLEQASSVRPPAADVVLKVEKGATLEGRVVDSKGEPVASLHLYAQSVGPSFGAPSAARTDANGRFRFAGVPRGEVVVGATVDGKRVELGRHRAPATDVTVVVGN